jgi:hypothetical protein
MSVSSAPRDLQVAARMCSVFTNLSTARAHIAWAECNQFVYEHSMRLHIQGALYYISLSTNACTNLLLEMNAPSVHCGERARVLDLMQRAMKSAGEMGDEIKARFCVSAVPIEIIR